MADDIVRVILRLKDEASSGLKDTASAAKDADDSIDGAQGSASGFSISLAALAGAAVATATAIFNLADSASAWVDATVNMSRQTGLATETIIALDFAAQAGGGSFQQLQSGLRTFTANLSLAKSGTGKAAEALADLGVSVTDAGGNLRDADDVLRETIDGIGKLDSQTKRATAATDIFGARGSALVAVLGDSTAALDEWGDAAAAAGIQIDQGALKASRDMDRVQTELRITTKGLAQTLGEEFTPEVVSATRSVNEFVKAISDNVHAMMEFVDGMTIVQSFLADLVFGAIGALIEGMSMLADAFVDSVDRITDRADAVEQLDLGGLFDVDALAKSGAAVSSVITDADIEAFRLLGERAAADERALKRMGKAAKDLRADMVPLIDQLLGVAEGFAIGTADADDWEAAMLAVQIATENGTLSAEDAVKVTEALTASWNQVEEAARAALVAQIEALGVTAPQRAFKPDTATGASDALKLNQGGPGVVELTQAAIGKLVGGITENASAIGGALAGSMGGITASLGPAGAIVRGLVSIGAAGGFEGVEAKLQEFEDNLIKGVTDLPQIIGKLLTDFPVSLVTKLIPALVKAAPRLLANLLTTLPRLLSGIFGTFIPMLIKELPKAIRQGMRRALQVLIRGFIGLPRAAARAFALAFVELWQRVKEFFASIMTKEGRQENRQGRRSRRQGRRDFRQSERQSDRDAFRSDVDDLQTFQSGTQHVDRTGMALVHQGEEIVQKGGVASGPRMGGGGATVNLTINPAVVDPNAIPALVRQIEEAFGGFGRGSSPLFAGG